jgi:hypothetical protein
MINSVADLLKQLDGLDANEVALLVTLYRFADAGGTCFPSHETIGARLNRSRQWVMAGLKRLERQGHIVVTKRYDSTGGRTSNVYSLKTPVQNLTRGCPENMGSHGQDLASEKTHQESKNPPTSRAGQVVNMPLPMPQGWCPSAAIIARALLQFPDMTDQDLADHTAKFTTRCRAKGYTYADFNEAWLDWLVRDRKEAKEKASAAGHRHESPYERQQRDAREREAENRRRADDCLARINGGHPRH